MNYEVSYAEKLLIDHFGFTYLLENKSVLIIGIYRILIEEAFMKNDQSKYASALRLAWDKFNKGVYRLTPEFDNTILDELRSTLIKEERLKKIIKINSKIEKL